ncbi:glycoside hydrolase family 76 protein [Tomitella gaofuii]|uniref:glycoside hydrolase family 76 protein n=1 Tax=Tomitella gaofuii TaxID=2760083 RepID=UPI0015FE75DA|nr:glycoside hydrolase family 76 protein [Tomitella gaofuii]
MSLPGGPSAQLTAWASRADAAESAVVHRHIRRLWAVPWTRMGCARWPADVPSGTFVSWHYWWQAQLIDCAVDATLREPTPVRRRRLGNLCRTPWIRNSVSRSGSIGWRRDFHDDMAWMALALERATRLCGVRKPRGFDKLTAAIVAGADPVTGVLPWQRGGDFLNAATNGPAAILCARLGRTDTAERLCDWLDATLRDPQTALIHDGIRKGVLVEDYYTYCQGAVLGAETELAAHAADVSGAEASGVSTHGERIGRLLEAVSTGMCVGGVIHGDGGEDGGLFAGILARYLARVACDLPDAVPDADLLRGAAANLVLTSAEAAWGNRIEFDGEPLFGHEWVTPAVVPAALFRPDDPSARVAERDLSVQVSGWMLMEAAAQVEKAASGYGAG